LCLPSSFQFRDSPHLLHPFPTRRSSDLSSPNDVKIAIENENDAYLTQFPGIGKKTARQIVLDLKGKVQIHDVDSSQLLNVDAGNNSDSAIIKEAMLALEALGYSKRELTKVEKTLSKESFDSVDNAVRRGLQLLVS